MQADSMQRYALLPVIAAWHMAVNAGDVAAAQVLVTEDVLVGGPRGQTQGAEVHRRWVAEAGIRLEPVDWQMLDARTVVVAQDATWPGRADAEPDVAPLRVATRFHLSADGRQITAILRFDRLDDALAGTEERSPMPTPAPAG